MLLIAYLKSMRMIAYSMVTDAQSDDRNLVLYTLILWYRLYYSKKRKHNNCISDGPWTVLRGALQVNRERTTGILGKCLQWILGDVVQNSEFWGFFKTLINNFKSNTVSMKMWRKFCGLDLYTVYTFETWLCPNVILTSI